MIEYNSKEYRDELSDIIDCKLGKVLYAIVWIDKKLCSGDVRNEWTNNPNVIGLYTTLSEAKKDAAKIGYVDPEHSTHNEFNQYVEIIEFKFSRVINTKK